MEHAVPSKGFTKHYLLGKLVEHLKNVHEAGKEGEDKKIVCGSGLVSNEASDGVWTVIPTSVISVWTSTTN